MVSFVYSETFDLVIFMINQWLSWLNYALLSLALLLGTAGALLWVKRPHAIQATLVHSKNGQLPKSAFELPSEAYQNIGGDLLALQQHPPRLQLPDLKPQLIYYGKNGRPDAEANRTLLHFSLGNNKAIASVRPNEPLYLIYDKTGQAGRYCFNPNNAKTSLWIDAEPIDHEVVVKVILENDQGERITEPDNHAQFRLPEKELIRHAGTTWEIGSFRVDGTLLARQKARWVGIDRFLEHHGGKEYQAIQGKHRIDFGEPDHFYSAFVKVGDCLIWDDHEWKVVSPGEESLRHPLLVVKKIEERLLSFELWDVEGKGKTLLNLLKSSEPWTMQNGQILQQMFKFVGAKTRKQCVFEVNHERMTLSPSDWLLFTAKGWKKLDSLEEIDNYVQRKTTGTLFIFEGISRKEIVKGTLYNPARTEFQSVELALQASNISKPSSTHEGKEEVTKEKAAAAARSEGEMMSAASSSSHHPSKDQSSNR